MKLRAFALILPLALGLLAAPLLAEAQQSERLRRVGVISPFSGHNAVTKVILEGLHDLGWIEGQNIVVEWRFTAGRRERIPALIAELLGLKVEVLYAPTTPLAEAAKNATLTIPIVVLVADPVAVGLVASLARPGGNITGVSLMTPELSAKRLQLLKEALPGIGKVGVLVNPLNSFSPILLRRTRNAAASLGVQLQILEVSDPKALESAFSAMTREHVDAVIPLADVMFFRQRRRIVELAAKHGLPAIYELPPFVRAGGLMSYGANILHLQRQAAALVDKILKGFRPADLPIEQPTQFALWINLKTAKALGLTIPASVLFRADEVIR